MATIIDTPRLVLTPWAQDDAQAALGIYGQEQVASSLAPVMDRVMDLDQMRAILRVWAEENTDPEPTGHWAVQLRAGRRVVGGCSLRHLPGDDTDVQLTWALAPPAWGHGYATEAGAALAHWAMHETGIYELYALVQAENKKGVATAVRIGMEWVREIGDDPLQVYRLRHADLGSTDLTADEVLDEVTR